MKKLTSQILLAAILVSLVSCGGEAAQTGETTAASDESTTAPAVETAYTPPEIDYEGYTFNMLVPLDPIYYESEEITGDVVSDAVYTANRKVESLYNVELEFVAQDNGWYLRDQFMNTIRSSVMANDNAYDIVFPAYYYGETLALEGLFLDYNSISSVHLDEPWWVAGYNDQAELFGKLYGAVGDYNLSDLENQMVLYFNKRIADEHKIGNLYDLVRSGDWTLDKLEELSKGLAVDLDNNEKYDDSDSYGYILNTHGARSFVVNFGINFVKRDESGTPYISLGEERTFDVYERLYTLIHKTNDTYPNNDMNVITKVFMDGRSLFMTSTLSMSALMREMADDFGILPMPKYDSAQEDYITYSIGPSLCCIPNTAADPERTGAIIDAINFYTHEEVLPAYYEVALKSKYARDNDTAEMLDIIRENTFYDFGFIYGTPIGAVADIFGNALILDKRESFSSYYASLENKFKTSLETMLDTYKALG